MSPDAQFRRMIEAADALLAQGRAAEAESVLALALRLRPDCPAARDARGRALFDLGRMDDALACFQAIIRSDPRCAAAWGNCGMVLKTLDRFDAAIAAYDHAVALDPESNQLRLNRAVALLRAGRWAEAWRDYEPRLLLRCATGVARLLPTLGTIEPDLCGRTVLVLHEEGFGDTLQFARYCAPLAQRGARVVMAVPRPLARLMRNVAGVAEVVAREAALPPHDYLCPVFSLPRVFATTIDSIPNASPYLHPHPDLVGRWEAMVPWRGSRRLRVGLVWAGQARPWLEGFAALDRRRSAGAAAFAPLRALEIELVSLQKDVSSPADFPMHDVMARVVDFADTAAIIAHLDVVVSVDTAVAHLAAGMGKKVLLVDRFDACWRWLSGRTDSPWYPTLRIFRQTVPGDWTGPVNGVVAALRDIADASASPAAIPIAGRAA